MTWTYENVKIERVVDGDTYVIAWYPTPEDDLKRRRLRLFGVNTPEKNRAESKEAGLAATYYVQELIEGKTVTIHAHGVDSFGRYLADVMVGSLNLGRHLLEEDYAVIYKR
jgi:endonuclease YncB( thermonuclease family)